MLTDFLTAIEAWPLAAFLRRSLILYPLVNALHILGLAFLVGAIAALDLRILGLFGKVPLEPLARALPPVAAAGLAVAVAAGLLLFIVRPLDYVSNPAFLVKIGLVAAGVANALTQRQAAGWGAVLDGLAPDARLKVGAVLSLSIWCAAVVAGRWIGYLD